MFDTRVRRDGAPFCDVRLRREFTRHSGASLYDTGDSGENRARNVKFGVKGESDRRRNF